MKVILLCTGLPSHPQYELVKRQCTGCPGMITFYIKGNLEHASAFLSNLKVSTRRILILGAHLKKHIGADCRRVFDVRTASIVNHATVSDLCVVSPCSFLQLPRASAAMKA